VPGRWKLLDDDAPQMIPCDQHLVMRYGGKRFRILDRFLGLAKSARWNVARSFAELRQSALRSREPLSFRGKLRALPVQYPRMLPQLSGRAATEQCKGDRDAGNRQQRKRDQWSPVTEQKVGIHRRTISPAPAPALRAG